MVLMGKKYLKQICDKKYRREGGLIKCEVWQVLVKQKTPAHKFKYQISLSPSDCQEELKFRSPVWKKYYRNIFWTLHSSFFVTN